MNRVKLLRMLLREWFVAPGLDRRPEPTEAMDDQLQVDAFHRAGQHALLPVYQFNALGVSALAPQDGTVLDLGSGSGRFLAYLSQRRPDLKVIGLDLSANMIAVGRRHLAEQGLLGRVDFRQGDMTCFAESMPERVDVVSSVFSLHHLPTSSALAACLAEVSALNRRFGSAVWIFDHVRPRATLTADEFPEVFTPGESRAFRQDSSNSLRAAFSFEEMSGALKDAGLGAAAHHCSRWMKLYQVHTLGSGGPRRSAGLWVAPELPSSAAREAASLASLFPALASPATAGR